MDNPQPSPAENGSDIPASENQSEPVAGDSVNELPAKKTVLSGATKNAPLLLACVASMGIGFALSWFTSGSEEPVAVETVISRPSYVASISHRKEPISPLAPFDDLDPAVVSLGKRLFNDKALSGTGKVACASCHDVANGGEDGLAKSVGVHEKVGNYNTPTVVNAALNFAQFWTGRARSLEEQVDETLTNHVEFDSSWERVTTYLNNQPSYSRAFHKHLGGKPTPTRVKNALATYERSLITVDSKFDQWLRGDEEALSANEVAGYYLFQRYNCISCHQGDNVGGSMLQPLGKLKDFFAQQRDLTEADLGRFTVTENESDRYVFRVPPLRCVELTAPYFHDGSVKTIEEAVEAMLIHQVGVQPNDGDVRRITLFLKSLSAPLPKPQPDAPSGDQPE